MALDDERTLPLWEEEHSLLHKAILCLVGPECAQDWVPFAEASEQ